MGAQPGEPWTKIRKGTKNEGYIGSPYAESAKGKGARKGENQRQTCVEIGRIVGLGSWRHSSRQQQQQQQNPNPKFYLTVHKDQCMLLNYLAYRGSFSPTQ